MTASRTADPGGPRRWIVVTIGGRAGAVQYGSDGQRRASLKSAITHGLKKLGHDNFVIAELDGDQIVAVTFMGRPWYDRFRQAVIDQLGEQLCAG